MASVYCNAAFNYFDEQGLVTHELPILNAREADCQWQTCGFERIHLPSAVHDWQDAAEVEKVHYDEITAYAKQRTGAHSVLFYPATLRSPAALKQSADFGPIQFVHSDYTESYRQIIGNADHPYHHILQPSMARAGVSAEVIRSASRVLQ